MKFMQSNPVTVYWNVMPYRNNTDSDLYPKLDYLEFHQASGMGVSGCVIWNIESQQFSKNHNSLINHTLTTMKWNKTKVEPAQTIKFIYYIGEGNLNLVTFIIL